MSCRLHLLQHRPHSGDAQVSGGHEDTGPAAVVAYKFQGFRSYSNCCYAVMSEMVTRASRLVLPFKPLLMATPDDQIFVELVSLAGCGWIASVWRTLVQVRNAGLECGANGIVNPESVV